MKNAFEQILKVLEPPGCQPCEYWPETQGPCGPGNPGARDQGGSCLAPGPPTPSTHAGAERAETRTEMMPGTHGDMSGNRDMGAMQTRTEMIPGTRGDVSGNGDMGAMPNTHGEMSGGSHMPEGRNPTRDQQGAIQ